VGARTTKRIDHPPSPPRCPASHPDRPVADPRQRQHLPDLELDGERLDDSTAAKSPPLERRHPARPRTRRPRGAAPALALEEFRRELGPHARCWPPTSSGRTPELPRRVRLPRVPPPLSAQARARAYARVYSGARFGVADAAAAERSRSKIVAALTGSRASSKPATALTWSASGSASPTSAPPRSSTSSSSPRGPPPRCPRTGAATRVRTLPRRDSRAVPATAGSKTPTAAAGAQPSGAHQSLPSRSALAVGAPEDKRAEHADDVDRDDVDDHDLAVAVPTPTARPRAVYRSKQRPARSRWP